MTMERKTIREGYEGERHDVRDDKWCRGEDVLAEVDVAGGVAGDERRAADREMPAG
jgi:hypothetical protein